MKLTEFNSRRSKEPHHMLTQEEDVEFHALRQRGWTIAAIARHPDRSRITIRAYLSGEGRPGERWRSTADGFSPYEPYLRERLREDPDVWASGSGSV